MYGDLRDYERFFAQLDFHHVGILTLHPPSLSWTASGYIPDFSCSCFLIAQTEFVVPDKDSTLYKAWLKSGDRLHHIAYKCGDVLSLGHQLEADGFSLLLKAPVRGIGSMLVNFVMPEQRGVLIELVQEV